MSKFVTMVIIATKVCDIVNRVSLSPNMLELFVCFQTHVKVLVHVHISVPSSQLQHMFTIILLL